MAYSLSELLFGCALVFSVSNVMISYYHTQQPLLPLRSGSNSLNLLGLESFFGGTRPTLSAEELQVQELQKVLNSTNEDLQKALNLTWDLLKEDEEAEENLESLEDMEDGEGDDANATSIDGEEDDPAEEDDGADMADMDVDVDTSEKELMIPSNPDDPNAAGFSVREDIGDVVPSLDEHEDDPEGDQGEFEDDIEDQSEDNDQGDREPGIRSDPKNVTKTEKLVTAKLDEDERSSEQTSTNDTSVKLPNKQFAENNESNESGALNLTSVQNSNLLNASNSKEAQSVKISSDRETKLVGSNQIMSNSSSEVLIPLNPANPKAVGKFAADDIGEVVPSKDKEDSGKKPEGKEVNVEGESSKQASENDSPVQLTTKKQNAEEKDGNKTASKSGTKAKDVGGDDLKQSLQRDENTSGRETKLAQKIQVDGNSSSSFHAPLDSDASSGSGEKSSDSSNTGAPGSSNRGENGPVEPEADKYIDHASSNGGDESEKEHESGEKQETDNLSSSHDRTSGHAMSLPENTIQLSLIKLADGVSEETPSNGSFSDAEKNPKEGKEKTKVLQKQVSHGHSSSSKQSLDGDTSSASEKKSSDGTKADAAESLDARDNELSSGQIDSQVKGFAVGNGGGRTDSDANDEDNELLREAMDVDEEADVRPSNDITNRDVDDDQIGDNTETLGETVDNNSLGDASIDSHKPWLVLHVGPRETGTPRIQSSFVRAGSKLQKLLENDGWRGVSFAYPKIQHIFTECFQKQDKDCSAWEELLKEITGRGNVIFASETFSKIPSNDYTTQLFRRLQEQFRVRIVLVYQPLHVWLWAMYIKTSKAEFRKLTNRRSNSKKIATFRSFIQDRTSVDTDPLATYERFLGIYGVHNIVVLENQETLVVDFACRALPNAKKSCRFLQDHPAKDEKKSSSYQEQQFNELDHNLIVMEAYRSQLLVSSFPQEQALEAVGKYRAQDTRPLFRIPLTTEDEAWLWNRTTVAVNILRSSKSNKNTLQRSFNEYSKKYFASVDASTTVKLKTWKAFFKSMKSKE